MPEGAAWAVPLDQVVTDASQRGLLGRGAFGEVRRGLWQGLPVAVKTLHALVPGMSAAGAGADADAAAAAAATDALAAALLSEIKTLASLRHPNLLLLVGLGFDRVTRRPAALLTALADGSVFDLLHGPGRLAAPLDEHHALRIALDVARGLAYLHGRADPIVHRDLSARNVLLDGGRAVIGDLGQAKVLGGALARHSNSSAAGAAAHDANQLTAMPGAMVYAAPEVLTGRYGAVS